MFFLTCVSCVCNNDVFESKSFADMLIMSSHLISVHCAIMSINHHNSILAVLNILCNISEEALQSHHSQALLVFQKLQIFVVDDDINKISPWDNHNFCLFSWDDHDSMSSSTDNHNSALSSSDDHDSIFSTDNHDSFSSWDVHDFSLPSQDLTLKLIKALNKKLTLISQYLTNSRFKAVKGASVWINENPHVVDL